MFWRKGNVTVIKKAKKSIYYNRGRHDNVKGLGPNKNKIRKMKNCENQLKKKRKSSGHDEIIQQRRLLIGKKYGK